MDCSKNLSENLHGRVVTTAVELQGRVTSRQTSSRSDDAADRLLSSQSYGTPAFAVHSAAFVVADICRLLLTPRLKHKHTRRGSWRFSDGF
jgi:hypothetical protein